MVAAVVVVGDGVSLCFGTSPSNLHSQIYDYYSQSQSQLRVYLIQVTEVSFILHFGMLCLILHGSTVRFFFVRTLMDVHQFTIAVYFTNLKSVWPAFQFFYAQFSLVPPKGTSLFVFRISFTNVE